MLKKQVNGPDEDKGKGLDADWKQVQPAIKLPSGVLRGEGAAGSTGDANAYQILKSWCPWVSLIHFVELI